MRRFLILGLTSLLLFSFLAAVVWAQNEEPATPTAVATPDRPPILLDRPPAQMIDGAWQPHGPQTNAIQIPLVPVADPAADSCEVAPELTFTPPGNVDSAVTIVNSFTQEESDPDLTCMWGSPSRIQGYRTAWYKLEAPQNGRVTIETLGSSYDTVLAVYSGACDALVEVACNDDYNGFSSRVSFTAARNQTYYIEVADWHEAIAGEAKLQFIALLEPVESEWNLGSSIQPQRSRHTAVVVGKYIYVIGGQTSIGDTAEVTTRVDRLDTSTGNWVARQRMPGVAGYSNTTAAHVNGRIYLPSGYNGNPNQFAGTHRVYDIAGDFWTTAASVPWPDGIPFAWSAAVTAPDHSGYYLAGGLSSQPPLTTTAGVRNELFFYDATANQWQSKTSMDQKRYAHTAAWVGGRLCVAGGLDANGEDVILLSGVECYDPGANSWTGRSSLQVPRYSAGSAVGPDGKWYVFGGVDGLGEVSITEVYDPATDSWTMLPVAYDLGGTPGVPARSWPRGGFVGHTLWVVGGDFFDAQSTNVALPLVQNLYFPPFNLALPYVEGGSGEAPDDTFAQARVLAATGPRQFNFNDQEDLYDFFIFYLPEGRAVTVSLSKIGDGNNYDLALYEGDKKELLDFSDNIGDLDETIHINLFPSIYYVVVERISPDVDPGDFYQIEIEW